MEKDAQKMFEMMRKLNPSFKLNEDGFNSSFGAQPTFQSTGQTTGQPTFQSTGQTTGQPTSQSTAQPTSQSTAQSTGQTTGQPTSQSTAQPTSQSTAQSTDQTTVQPTYKSTNHLIGDDKIYDDAMQANTAMTSKSAKINTATEFPDAFKTWFTKLGYSPDNGDINIAKVLINVKKAMLELGYK
jgi:hypothetical protein